MCPEKCYLKFKVRNKCLPWPEKIGRLATFIWGRHVWINHVRRAAWRICSDVSSQQRVPTGGSWCFHRSRDGSWLWYQQYELHTMANLALLGPPSNRGQCQFSPWQHCGGSGGQGSLAPPVAGWIGLLSDRGWRLVLSVLHDDIHSLIAVHLPTQSVTSALSRPHVITPSLCTFRPRDGNGFWWLPLL